LHQAFLRRKHQVRSCRVVPDLNDLRNLLVRLECQQVGDMLTLSDPTRLRQLISLCPVYPALIREEQDPVVGGGYEEVADDIVLTQRRAADALSATLL